MVQEGGWKRAPPEGPVSTSVDEDEEQRHLEKREKNIFMKRKPFQSTILTKLSDDSVISIRTQHIVSSFTFAKSTLSVD